MKGDFTRDTFDASKHFSRVLMQQGRVQVDADWNEQASILLHYLRMLATDLIGPHGGPDDGFRIGVDATTLGLSQSEWDALGLEAPEPGDFLIRKGHYYVDGVLCENEDYVLYAGQRARQPDWSPGRLAQGTFLVYLDVWERHVTHIEDGSIREVALGMSGPDTATRAQVVWQVKSTNKTPDGRGTLSSLPAGEIDWRTWVNKKDNWSGWLGQWQPTNRGWLKAKVEHDSDKDTDPCITPPDAGYRGAENQLYRVEIHRPGVAWDGQTEDKGGNATKAATFKWSRDNGSVVAAWVGKEGNDLLVSGIHDAARGFAAGQWVELTDDTRELRGEPGTMVRLVKVEGEALTIDPLTATGPVDWNATMKYPKVRRWDQSEREDTTLSEGGVRVEEGKWLDLEDGIRIWFEPVPSSENNQAPPHSYCSGDYWLVPARTATGDVEWPGPIDQPEARPPHGVEHHYAPLAIISVSGSTVAVEANLRRTIKPLGEPVP